MPTLPELVSYTLGPDTVHPPMIPVDDQVVSPVLSAAVNTYPIEGDCPVIVKFVVRIVPCTSKVCPGLLDPIPTLPPVNNPLKVALLKVGVPVNVFADVPLCV